MERQTVKRTKAASFAHILAAIVGVALALGAPVRGATDIVATGDPATDFAAIQNALDAGGEVILQNGPHGEIFDLSRVNASLRITRDVVLRGEDDATGNRARVMAGDLRLAGVQIDNPGGTVELVGLDIESGAVFVVLVGDSPYAFAPRDACKDFRVKDCKIEATHVEAGCLVTLAGITGTFYLEGNHIVGHWCVADWAHHGGFQSRCSWEVHSNTFVATASCLDPQASEGVRMVNNHCEGPFILYSPATRGEIVVRDNTLIQSGHNVHQGNNACGILVSHADGFSGGEIRGNRIKMNPTEDVGYYTVAAMALSDAEGGLGAHGLLVQDNTIIGKADLGIVLANGASNNILKRNNLEYLTALEFGSIGAAHIVVGSGCYGNVITRNAIGSPGEGAFGGIVCLGTDNDIIRNDYAGSGIPGLTTSDLPCVILSAASERNLVFEPGRLPPGTGGATEQVLDLSSEPTPDGTPGTTANIVVGHSADILAEDINPGVGQRVENALAVLP